MKTLKPKSLSIAQIEEKKSQFISYLLPYSDFEIKLKELKEEHPKAVHFITAFRHMNEQRRIDENGSDDGEPKGSSGKPTLNVLIGHDLVNVAIITVRYFGGTKLGVGGLVRAYSDAANAVLTKAHEEEDFIPFEFLKEASCFVDFSHLNQVLYWLEKDFISISEKIFDTVQGGVHLKLSMEEGKFEALKLKLEKINISVKENKNV